MKVIILVLAIMFITIALSAKLNFTQEILTFRLKGKVFLVNGDYWFSNDSHAAISQQLYYPIPDDYYLAAAEKLILKLKKPLPGQKVRIISSDKKGIWFEIILPAKTIAVCQIAYQQKLFGWKAKYILLSANSWGRPLEYAKYTLITPSKIVLEKVPLPSPTVKKKWFTLYYTWEFNNYRPDRDFIVEFKQPYR